VSAARKNEMSGVGQGIRYDLAAEWRRRDVQIAAQQQYGNIDPSVDIGTVRQFLYIRNRADG